MRPTFETIEEQLLAPYAVKSKNSLGRQYKEPLSETRTCFQRDRDRIIHSKAFRRLKHKTQVFVATESDHYRSRLTHTIEVAQISRHLARMLRLNEDLAESIALAHDLGHTPFGHAGERELNTLMKEYGGFEHNLQSLRVVELLEDKYPEFPGLNLSIEVREGLNKHITPWDNPQLTDTHPDHPHVITLESQVCNIADEIAYNNHDIDDGLRSGILKEEDLDNSVTLWQETKKMISDKYTHLHTHQRHHLINSQLISALISDVFTHTQKQLQTHTITSLQDIQTIPQSIVRFSPETAEKNKELRKFLFKEFYSHPNVYRMNQKGRYIIRDLFQEFQTDSKLLPTTYQNKIRENPSGKERIIADYIAGMTDIFAQKEHEAIWR